MLQMKLVSGFYQGPIKALQATGAVWWSRWGSRCRPVKVFFFLATWFEVETTVFLWVGEGSEAFCWILVSLTFCQDHSQPHTA